MTTTTITRQFNFDHSETLSQVSIWTNFMTWCSQQESNRLIWLAIALGFHGCVLTPLTLMAVVFTGNNFILFVIGIIAMTMVLVPNLAAQSAKISIPTFFLSLLIDIGVIISAFALAV